MFEHIVFNEETDHKEFINRGIFLMERFAECEELEGFTTKGLIDNVEFKWEEFGK